MTYESQTGRTFGGGKQKSGKREPYDAEDHWDLGLAEEGGQLENQETRYG